MNAPADYAEMKAFLRFFSHRFLDQRTATGADQPVTALEKLEQESPDRAPAGLRMAVNNCMEISAPWLLSQIESLDKEMHAQGLITLSQVRYRVWGRCAAMLKRRQIRNDQEWAVAQGVLSDASMAESLPAPVRESLLAMSASYNNTARPRASLARPATATHTNPRHRTTRR